MFDSETQVRPTGLILGTLHSIKRPNLITLLTWSSIIILCVLSPFIFQENSIIPLKQSLRDVLIANISLNIPPALDLVFEYIYLQKEVEFELSPTCVIVLASILPNILIIFYVLPNNSTKLMMGLFSIQLITCSQLILTYMLKNLVFMQKAALLRLLKWVWIISIILSNFADNSTDIGMVIKYISLVLFSIFIMYYVFILCKWISFIFRSDNNIPKQQYGDSGNMLINICLISFTFLIISYGILLTLQLEEYTPIVFICIYSFSGLFIIIMNNTINKRAAIISRNALISQRAFMRHVSHEIRTPLNTICLGIELVRKSICNGSDAVELLEDLADIETSANVAVETLSEMLLFDKLREGNVPIEKTKFLIAEFLTSTIQPFYIQARSSQLKLDLIVQDSDRLFDMAYLDADYHKLRQVLRNMLSNALKFTPQGGSVVVMARILPRKLHINDIIDDAAAAIKELVIDVTDNGPGITPENQSKLFRGVVQFDAGKLQSGGGSGLGLCISHGLMLLHEGNLSVHSEGEGFGCTFTMTIPVLQQINNDNKIVHQHKGSTTLRYNDNGLPTLISPSLPLPLPISPDRKDGSSSTLLPIIPKLNPLLRSSSQKDHLTSDGNGNCDCINDVNGDDVDFASGILSPISPTHINMNRYSSNHLYHISSKSEYLPMPNVIKDDDEEKGHGYELNRSVSDAFSQLSPQRGMGMGMGMGMGVIRMIDSDAEEYKGRGMMMISSSTGSSSLNPSPSRQHCWRQQQQQQLPSSPTLFLSQGDNNNNNNGNNININNILQTNSQKGTEKEKEKKLHTLIVDDSVSNLKMLKRLLREYSKSIETAENGIEALNKYHEACDKDLNFDVILMDYEMPNMNGPTATRELRELGYTGLIIGVTGNALQHDVDYFMSQGANIVLIKPLKAQQIEDALRSGLQGM